MAAIVNNNRTIDLTDAERFMESERNAMEHYRLKANKVIDPALKSLFKKLSEEHGQWYLALESYIAETSSKDILNQLNEMFE